jgi:ribbon-helix-helix protein
MAVKERILVGLTPEQWKGLERIKEKTHAPIAAQIREAVDAYLAKKGK